MKTLLAGAALAAALASPALSQTIPQYQSAYAQAIANGRHGYVYPPDNHAHSSNPANDVYDTRGRYVGSDPDPFIRDTMARSNSKD
jgi:opacity protein-like surface antigen